MSFEEAFNQAIEACAVLGPDYVAMMTSLRDAHRMDYCPNRGRKPGSYMHLLRRQPFLFFNYNGSYRDRRIVVHEVSHAVHMILGGQRTESGI